MTDLTKHYNIIEKDDRTVYRCKICRRGWSRPKDDQHGGNTLFLLNHAASHEPQDDEDDDE